jgi:competence protein ComEA
VAFYTRPQLALLLALLTAAAVGIGVGRWRAAHPDAVERLETFDREVAPTARPASNGTSTAPPASTSHAIKSAPPANETPPHASGERRSRRRAVPSPSPDASPAPPLDVNRASEADLVQLPGVGRVLAGRILAAREAAGRFRTIEDLRGVPGLGAARFESLRRLLVASP